MELHNQLFEFNRKFWAVMFKILSANFGWIIFVCLSPIAILELVIPVVGIILKMMAGKEQ